MERSKTVLERLQEAKKAGKKFCFQKEYKIYDGYRRYVDTYVYCRKFCEDFEDCRGEEVDEMVVHS